jgi:hypothetical protein
MMAPWSTVELDIIETLARRVHILTHGQIVAIWGSDSQGCSDLECKLTRLHNGKLCERAWINVHPRLPIEAPLASWQPQMARPDFDQLEQQVRARWSRLAQSTRVYWASRQAANLFGSSVHGVPDLLHRDHDVLLAEVYVFYRQRRPKFARKWLGENVFPKAGYRIKDPDAFLVQDDGTPLRVIESAGRYGRQQIEEFHDHCDELDLPYELW